MAEGNLVQLSIKSTLVADLHQAFLVYIYRCDRSDERIQRAVKKLLGYPVPSRKSRLSIPWKPNDFSIWSLSKACGGGLLLFCQDAEVPKANEDVLGSAKSCRDQDWSEAGD